MGDPELLYLRLVKLFGLYIARQVDILSYEISTGNIIWLFKSLFLRTI